MSSDESAEPVTPLDAAALYRLEPAALRCPFPIFERYRTETPVTWEPAIEAFVVSRYDDIVEVTRQPELFSTRLVHGPVLDRQMQQIMTALAQEEPEVAELV